MYQCIGSMRSFVGPRIRTHACKALCAMPNLTATSTTSTAATGGVGQHFCIAALYHQKPGAQGLRTALESFPSPAHTLSEGGHRDGEAADYVISEVTETVRHIRYLLQLSFYDARSRAFTKSMQVFLQPCHRVPHGVQSDARLSCSQRAINGSLQPSQQLRQ